MTAQLSNAAAQLAPSIIRQMSGRRRPTSIDLSLGQPALPPDEEILTRAFERLHRGPAGYTATAGLEELRALIAAHHALPGRTDPTNVIVTVGSEQAVYLAMLSSIDPGSEVLIPQPGYPAYRGVAGLIGATAVGYPLTREGGLVARAEEIERRITDRTQAVVLNSPSNPFGMIDLREELVNIAQLAERFALTIITDEIYRDVSYVDMPPSIATLTDRAIFVSGLSKSCAMTGLRLGYLVADAAFVTQATLAHQLVVTCAPTLSQYAAVEVFKKPERLRAHIPFYEEARRAVRAAKGSVRMGDGAFYAIVDVEAWCDRDPLALALDLLEKQDVVVVPGNAFGDGGEWFWRLSYAAGSEAIREGLRRIDDYLSKL